MLVEAWLSMTGIKQTFSNNLRRLLERDHISQRELARRIGVTESAVSNWVKGKNWAGDAEIDAMVKECKWSVSELISGDDSSMAKLLKAHNSSNSPFKISLK